MHDSNPFNQVPPRVSPQVTAQISLDAQIEAGNSSFADFTQFPESVIEVIAFCLISVHANPTKHFYNLNFKLLFMSFRHRKVNNRIQ